VDEVLALVEQPLQRRRERKSFDQVVARLAQPQLLHHNNKRLRGLTLDCLEQVVRICQLENNAKADANASEEAQNSEVRAIPTPAHLATFVFISFIFVFACFVFVLQSILPISQDYLLLCLSLSS
jgi:adenosyl cobinamide kinase/adenosyl cobinamide phosphate guanylyltransferase